MLASSFFDPMLGIDIHWEMVPMPAPVPTPIPNPFVGIVRDFKGLAAGLAISNAISAAMSKGAAAVKGPVLYWGVFPASNTGTNGEHVSGHILIPPGTAWAPVPKTPKPVVRGEEPTIPKPVSPDNDAIIVFGSKTVTVMGSNAVRFGDIALSCSEPLRLPSTVVMAVPKGRPILIGGPMSLDILAAILASLRTRFIGDSLQAGISRLPIGNRGRAILSWVACTLTGHPVDVATGKMMTRAVDAELPGPLPLKIERFYLSNFASRRGPLGNGWSCSLDQAVWEERGKIVLLAEDGREIEFDTFDFPNHRMRIGDEVWSPINRLTLRCEANGKWRVTSHDGVWREFAPVPGRTDGRARIQRIVSRCEYHEITFTYNGRGRLEWVRDSAGRLIWIKQDEHDRIVTLHLPDPHERGWYVHRRYEYDSDGDLVRAVDSLGHAWSFEYVTHLMVRETDRTGLSFYFEYDGLGEDAWCTRTWGDGGIYDHVVNYDKKNHVTYVTDSLGQTTSYFYNVAGLVTKVVDPLGAATQYEYDLRTLQETAREAPLGARSEKRYDNYGNLVEIVEPGGAVTRLEYDGFSVVHAMDARGGEWHWRYDQGGRLVERVLPTGEHVVLTWEKGLLVRSQSASGQRVTFARDEHKNPVAVTIEGAGTQRYEWDNLGRIVKVVTPVGGVTRFRYDPEGRPVETYTLSAVLQRVAYDAEGNVVEVLDPTRHVRYGYGHFHRRELQEEAGARLAYEYDTEGRTVGVVNEAGERYGFTRDANGRVIEEIGFDGGRRSYQLDLAGRIVRTIMPSRRMSERAYDVAGRLLEVSNSDGTFARFAYDVGGLLISAENQAARVEYERDDAGRVVVERLDGREVRSRFDATGERVEVATSLGAHVAVGRDVLGNPVDLSFGGRNGPSSAPDVQLLRDAAGRESVYRYANGIDVEWQRDLAGRPLSRRTSHGPSRLASTRTRRLAMATGAAPGRAPDERDYEWLGEDQIVAVIESTPGPVGYDHDARGRLVRERRTDAVIDRAEDRVGNVYRTPDGSDRLYGPGSRLEVADGVRYEHDADGNQVRRVEPDGRAWRFEWDGHGMLSEVERPDGARIQFAYDAFARRTTKRTIAATGATASETMFVWDGHTVVHEIDRDQGLVTWFWEPDTLTPIAKEHAGQRWAVVSDHLGTPTEMYDEAGQITWRMRLDVHGVPTIDAGSETDCPWRWAGQYADPELSLVYNRWRYYEPRRGSYISADPVGFGGGTNLYAYVDDPTTATDPFGLDAKIDDNGFFAPSHEYGRGSGSGRQRIPYQGTRGRDFTLADRLAGISEEWRQQHGYTWHHANYNARTGYGDMQLVRTDVHGNTPHAGGVSDFTASTGIKYDTPEAVKHVEDEGRNRGKSCG
jgi:RHS repeat-associated protein